MKISNILKEFLESEKAGGITLIGCTLLSLALANSGLQAAWLSVWDFPMGSHSVTGWINDGLMTLFFLMIGLELKREFKEGQFAHIKQAMLPVFAAIGGMLVPACFHLYFNYNTYTQSGAGIPMATDAAFALAILSIVGKRIPHAVKILLIALAVIDDLCAIIVIAVFYTGSIAWTNLGLSLLAFLLLLAFNQFKIKNLGIFLVVGAIMWYFMLHSGVHSTISGVLLALVIPTNKSTDISPSLRLQHFLHKPVAFIVLPLFALANTAIVLKGNFIENLQHPNSIGIMTGLLIGKPVGVFLFSALAVVSGIGKLNDSLQWKHIFGIGLLAGIGFTISIFISVLAFDQQEMVDQSKLAVLIASVASAILGFSWFMSISNKQKEPGLYEIQ